MQHLKIPKRSGGHRLIYVPSHKKKAKLRRIIEPIEQARRDSGVAPAAHGFLPKRSIVTNAMAHRRYAWTLTFDLKDFFDTVTRERLAGTLPDQILDQILVDGAARQGLPTSPAAANLAAVPLDNALSALVANKPIVYTRYADDLAFSFNDQKQWEPMLRVRVPQIVDKCGFVVHPGKTHLLCAKAGRRVICGVAVDETLHPTWRMKRRLRAAKHQNNHSQAAGLAEACKLKPPRRGRKRRQWEYAVRMVAQIADVARRLPPDATKAEHEAVADLLRAHHQISLPTRARRHIEIENEDDHATDPTSS